MPDLRVLPVENIDTVYIGQQKVVVQLDEPLLQQGGQLYSNPRQYTPIGPISSDVYSIITNKSSNLSFNVGVHLTLIPGKGLNNVDIPNLSCEQTGQAIRKAWEKSKTENIDLPLEKV